MKKPNTPLAEIAALHGMDHVSIHHVLKTAGLPVGSWRAYRLIRGEAKLKPTERTVLSAAFNCTPDDFDHNTTKTRIQ